MYASTALERFQHSALYVRTIEHLIPASAVVTSPDGTVVQWHEWCVVLHHGGPESLHHNASEAQARTLARYLAATGNYPVVSWYGSGVNAEPCWLFLPVELIGLSTTA